MERLMIFCARATRGLRRMRRERPGALLARRTRTIRMCSFDARSKGQSWPLPWIEVWRTGRPSLGLRARLGVPVGGRVRKPCAVEDQSAPIPEEIRSKLGGIALATLGCSGMGFKARYFDRMIRTALEFDSAQNIEPFL